MKNAPSGGKGKKVTKKQASRFRYKWLKVIYAKIDEIEERLNKIETDIRKLDFRFSLIEYKIRKMGEKSNANKKSKKKN